MPSLSVSQPFQTVHPIDLTAAGLVTLATPGKYGPDSSLISNTVVLQWFTGNAPAPRAACPISIGFPVFFTATQKLLLYEQKHPQSYWGQDVFISDSLPRARAFWKVTDAGILHWVQVKWWHCLVHLVVSSCLKSKWKTILFFF